ncbi:hypothetical protein ZWY2020_050088 [Hordeum vulgare]|nr:hypothetical protein ZWY2020_050088 [Hordeum vulgare]
MARPGPPAPRVRAKSRPTPLAALFDRENELKNLRSKSVGRGHGHKGAATTVITGREELGDRRRDRSWAAPAASRDMPAGAFARHLAAYVRSVRAGKKERQRGARVRATPAPAARPRGDWWGDGDATAGEPVNVSFSTVLAVSSGTRARGDGRRKRRW